VRNKLFPHFLCIGAQRSGTTWLNNALSLHPDIWTPPIKELHYFNLKSTAPSIIALAREPLMRYRLSRLLQGMARQAYKGQNIQWKLHYFFSLRNDQWYQSLFQPGVGQIAGETTPEYSILAPEVHLFDAKSYGKNVVTSKPENAQDCYKR
jgi:hypothetical protein